MLRSSATARGEGLCHDREMDMTWLYGPRVRPDLGGQPIWVRPSTIDIETVAELADLIESRVPDATVHIYVTDQLQTRQREIPRAILATLDAGDRRFLRLEAHHPAQNGFVSILLRADQTLNIYIGALPNEAEAFEAGRALAAELAEKIANNGTPILVWRRPLIHLPWVAFSALAVAWILTEFTTPIPVPLHFAGWIVMAFAGYVAHLAKREQRSGLLNRQEGIRIRLESRTDTAARRADERTNIKVAVITALISIPTTVLITLISTGL